MAYPVVATQAVSKRLKKRVPADVLAHFDEAVKAIAQDPAASRPDRPAVWRKVFPDIANHRHIDLRAGWRLCYAVQHDDFTREPYVLIVFLGTHKEYERKYGFTSQ